MTLKQQLKKVKTSIDLPTITQRIQQICIEDKYSKSNIKEKLIKAVDEAKDAGLQDSFYHCVIQVETYLSTPATYESKRIRIAQIAHMDVDKIVNTILINVIPCTELTLIQNVVTKVANIFDYADPMDGIKTASELISVGRLSGIFNMYVNPVSIQSNVSFSTEVLNFIQETQYLMPMLCKPDDWTNNNDGGYISLCSSIILKGYNHHTYQQAYDVINALQNIEWELDERILLEEEQPKKPLDTKNKIANWGKYIFSSKQVYRNMIEAGNAFYFEWKYDFRGRAYSQGYHTNLQSSSYKKASLNFKKKQLIKG